MAKLNLYTTDTVIINEAGYDHRQYYVGSAETDGAKYGACSARLALRNNAIMAKKNPDRDYAIAWISPHCSVVDNTGQSFKQYQERQAKAIVLHFGDTVKIEGRAYRVLKAYNQNVALAPVGKAVYGHPQKPRYTC